MIRTRLIFYLIFMWILYPASPVYAIEAPDNSSILTANGYGDVDEPGDILLVVHYDTDYGSNDVPDEPTSQTILLQYLDVTATSTSTAIRSASPFVLANNGYGHAITSIYFDTDEASSLNLTHGDADQARLISNPGFPDLSLSLSTNIVWRTIGSQTLFEDDIRQIADLMEEQPEWADFALMIVLSGRDVFDIDGENYFEHNIERLRQIGPGLFSDVITQPNFVEREFNDSFKTGLESSWDGSVLEDTFDSLASWWGMPALALSTSLILIGSMLGGGFIASVSIRNGVEREPSAGLAFLVSFTIIGLTAAMGIFNITVLAVFGFLGLLVLAVMFFLKRM